MRLGNFNAVNASTIIYKSKRYIIPHGTPLGIAIFLHTLNAVPGEKFKDLTYYRDPENYIITTSNRADPNDTILTGGLWVEKIR